jgi:hypothetical protein
MMNYMVCSKFIQCSILDVLVFLIVKKKAEVVPVFN